MEYILTAEHVTMCFGGLIAVNDVSLKVRKREIHSLIGPNGAGKTTLVSMINGTLPVPAGKICFDGREITGQTTYKLARMGMGRTFQNIKLFDSLTVGENLMLGATYMYEGDNFIKFMFTPKRQRDIDKGVRDEVRRTLEFFNLIKLIDEKVEKLAYGHKKIIELARTMIAKPKLILLDEPAAGLNPSERHEFIDIIRKIYETGVDMFIIEHNMDVVMNLSHMITVLNFGEKIAEGTPNEIKNNDAVINAYLGDRFRSNGGKTSC